MKFLLASWKKLGLSGQILLGLGLGIFAGLFFGEAAERLAPMADVYIRLMQMTVLPYLVTALVVGLGQLEMAQARRLAVRGLLMLASVWLVMIAVIGAMPLAFPEYTSASFYSSALVEPVQEFSLADIYFTANPFESLSRNVVPAVVMFSCLLGVALIGQARKNVLLDPLRVWNQAIINITHYVIALTPLGVFAIGAVTAGTMSAETFIRLEAYFVTFVAASLLLGFVILPLMVTAVTPFRYGEVVGIARDALLTAFVAHSAFIVLPILVERSKVLFERHGLLNEQTDSAAEVMIPVLFNFPNAGKLLSLLFIPFVAWLVGSPLAGGDYGDLFSAGIPSYFAKAQIALPYLLDLFSLPHDMFRLYIPTTVITGKFDSLVAAMNLLVFAMLGAAALGGFLRFEARRVLKALAIGAASLVLTVAGVRWLLAEFIDTTYQLDESVRQMRSVSRDTEVVVHLEPPAPDPVEPGRLLEHVRERGTLRIGYDPNNLPFSFFNHNDQLVGFDVELSIQLAATLGVTAEFVPLSWTRLDQQMAEGVIDITPGVWYRPNWFGRVNLSMPYMVATMGLAVRDERRHEFARIADLRESQGLKIGIPLDRRQMQYSMRRYFGDAEVEWVMVDFWQPFFEGEMPGVDAFLMPAEHASGWTLLHPEYTVVVPQPDPVKVATGFAMPTGAQSLAEVINEWIVFADNTGEIDKAYNYWVLGEGAGPSGPRWSILRNVLGLGTDQGAPSVSLDPQPQ